ncbi:MAG: 16S rRNA (adenine(1518)-N(6)/adenine(1519)-N(6))-dimethyltransferase RsmA [Desulfobacteraceae bacterium]|nr:16S rRNA (adenine(1518)-N(6)/adenine(1519)-N(6))-dimethyltransferase RsmA [Desulfobacteraceae bacterium]
MTGPYRLLSSRSLFPKKHMGQNFLADPSTAEMIARRATLSDAVVVEIGAGVGALTVFAAHAARRVYAVEKDRDLIGILESVVAEGGVENVAVVNKNIFDVDLQAIFQQENTRLTVIGNLPYNISSQVLISLIFQRDIIDRAVLMLQAEMARRIYAVPGTKAYGRLSVMTQYCAAVSRIARVRANQFYPRPNVDSEVIEICFQPPRVQAADEALLSAVVKAAFGQRRKTLRNALIGGELNITEYQTDTSLECAGISGGRRAETLCVDEFVSLANCVANITHPHV